MIECTCVWGNDPDQQHDETCPREIYLAQKSTATQRLAVEEVRLLRAYANGRPKIWDAASLFAVVVKLCDRGLIEPEHSSSGAYVITEAGLAALESEPVR